MTFSALFAALAGSLSGSAAAQTVPAGGPTNPILFVTQVPVTTDFTVTAVFSNHVTTTYLTPRGGDLYIRYPDGALRNLTREAGYGEPNGPQGARAIAVRNPSVHWSGQKALFSMVIGSPARLYDYQTYYWQMYEVTGLGKTETVSIRKIPGQPEDCNNVYPAYLSDGSIVFSSDRPKDGLRHLYPARDEYEGQPTLTGIYALSAAGQLRVIDFTPSGAFAPRVDSFGRIVYTRWDHMVRDQLALPDYSPFNKTSEALNAGTVAARETFPEGLFSQDVAPGTVSHYLSLFAPWTVNQDGTDSEFLNHVGRHELVTEIGAARIDDAAIRGVTSQRAVTVENVLIDAREDPTRPGRFLAVEPREFGSHSAGRILALNGAPTVNADDMVLEAVTITSRTEGRYRNPLPLSDGGLVAAHTPSFYDDVDTGTPQQPRSQYQFSLVAMQRGTSGLWTKSARLTSGIPRSINYYTFDYLTTFSGDLWELDPVEVVARPVPPMTTGSVPAIETSLAGAEGFGMAQLKQFLAARNLAMIVSRDVTTRDHADQQQAYNLRVQGTTKQTTGTGGRVYDVDQLQLLQADYLRGYGARPTGRRAIAVPLHDAPGYSIDSPKLAGATLIAPDGSVAALVPAGRPVTWHLTSATGESVVKERYWVNFQPGEVRVCASCHGINRTDQAGNPPPTNPPMALQALLRKIADSVDGSQQGEGSVAITSSAEAGLQTTFTARYSHPEGSKWLKYVGLQIDEGTNGGCLMIYYPRYRSLALLQDDQRTYREAVIGMAGTVSNSQCTVNTAAMSASSSADALTLTVPVTFNASYRGTKSVYGYTRDLADRYYGWARTGGFGIGGGGRPALVSATPAASTGSPATFTLTATDPDGNSDVTRADLFIGETDAQGCHLSYQVGATSAMLYLRQQNGSWASAVAGTNTVITGAGCSVDAREVTRTVSAQAATFSVRISPPSAANGPLFVFARLYDSAGISTNWQIISNWQRNGATLGPPRFVSGTPASATGTDLDLSVAIRDPDGTQDIRRVDLLAGASLEYREACHLVYLPSSRLLYLRGDAGEWLAGSTTTLSVLANSRCRVETTSVTHTSAGETMMVAARIRRLGGAVGDQWLFGRGYDVAEADTHWQRFGIWRAP